MSAVVEWLDRLSLGAIVVGAMVLLAACEILDRFLARREAS